MRRRKDVELEEDATNAIEDTSDNPEVAATKKDAGEVLRKCLGGLSPGGRRSRVAEIIGIPENTVKSACARIGRTAEGSGVERGWPWLH